MKINSVFKCQAVFSFCGILWSDTIPKWCIKAVRVGPSTSISVTFLLTLYNYIVASRQVFLNGGFPFLLQWFCESSGQMLKPSNTMFPNKYKLSMQADEKGSRQLTVTQVAVKCKDSNSEIIIPVIL